MKKRPPPADPPCPCGRGLAESACCGLPLSGTRPAPDAESLMRSRYTAFVRRDEAYLLATWHPATRPATLDLHAEPQPQWLGLTVAGHAADTADHAHVEFIARYRIGGRAHRLHEISRFVREDGRWFYVAGEIRDD